MIFRSAAAALLIFLGGCSPASVLSVFSPTGELEIHRDIAYGKNPQQRLDVYTPRRPEAGARATIVFFHGGYWDSGNRGEYLFVAEALPSRGFVVVLADYRLYPEVVFPGFVEDAAGAVAWSAAHAAEYGGDPKRLFVMGHSAGAHLAALVALDARYLAREGLTPAAISGLIGLAGPYDFLPLTSEKLRRVFSPEEIRPSTQPINFVTAAAPPALLATGDKDTTVQPGNTVRLAARLRDAHVPVTELHYPGLNHIALVGVLARPFRDRQPLLDDIERFVRANEKAAAQAPRPSAR